MKENIECFFAYCYFIGVIGMLAIFEWVFLGWYLITGFSTKSTINRIQTNKMCPSTVLGLYVFFKLGANTEISKII